MYKNKMFYISTHSISCKQKKLDFHSKKGKQVFTKQRKYMGGETETKYMINLPKHICCQKYDSKLIDGQK